MAVKEKPERKPKKEEPPEQSNRIFWVVPNFAAVSANTQLPPLSSHDKFVLAMHDSFDYSSFVWTGILATQSLMLNSDPELGHGFKGYTRYYWRTFVDGVSGTYFTEAIIPSLTHEDPRYYTLGRGGFFRRAGYALSRKLSPKPIPDIRLSVGPKWAEMLVKRHCQTSITRLRSAVGIKLCGVGEPRWNPPRSIIL